MTHAATKLMWLGDWRESAQLRAGGDPSPAVICSSASCRLAPQTGTWFISLLTSWTREHGRGGGSTGATYLTNQKAPTAESILGSVAPFLT